MKQIILNYLVIFIIPFLLGAFIRFLLRKSSKAWLITAISALLTLVAFIVKQAVPSYGSERYGLLCYMAVCLLAGSLFMEIITRMMGRKKCATAFRLQRRRGQIDLSFLCIKIKKIALNHVAFGRYAFKLYGRAEGKRKNIFRRFFCFFRYKSRASSKQ